MTTPLDDLFVKVRSENRAALIAYIPAGFPSVEGCKKVIKAFVDGGVDAIEIGFPYSDPVMDGPTIQAAADQSLSQGTGAREVFDALATASGLGVAAVVMTYWNPIEKYGVEKFAKRSSTMAVQVLLRQTSLSKSPEHGRQLSPNLALIPSMSLRQARLIHDFRL